MRWYRERDFLFPLLVAMLINFGFERQAAFGLHTTWMVAYLYGFYRGVWR